MRMRAHGSNAAATFAALDRPPSELLARLQSRGAAGRSRVGGVNNAARCKSKDGLSLGKIGRVVDAADALVTAAFAQREPGGGRVREHVAADRLLGVRDEHRAAVDLRDNLVRAHDRDTELVREAQEHAKIPPEMHLTRSELAAPGVVRAVERRERVDDKKRVPRVGHERRRLDKESHLMVDVERSRVRDVVQHALAVEAKALCNLHESLGAERALRVDVEALALAATRSKRELARHREGVAELRLARPELAKELGDRAGLDAATEKVVKLGRAGRDVDELLALLVELGRSREPHRHKLGGSRKNLVCLGLRDTLHLEKRFLRGERDGFDGVEASRLELLEIRSRDAFGRKFLQKKRPELLLLAGCLRGLVLSRHGSMLMQRKK
eukprot:Amastigsp_a509628_311.p1 type:complete len:384 gc:universal Amastigsp_a509628_311:42-1193(+)